MGLLRRALAVRRLSGMAVEEADLALGLAQQARAPWPRLLRTALHVCHPEIAGSLPSRHAGLRMQALAWQLLCEPLLYPTAHAFTLTRWYLSTSEAVPGQSFASTATSTLRVPDPVSEPVPALVPRSRDLAVRQPQFMQRHWHMAPKMLLQLYCGRSLCSVPISTWAATIQTCRSGLSSEDRPLTFLSHLRTARVAIQCHRDLLVVQ